MSDQGVLSAAIFKFNKNHKTYRAEINFNSDKNTKKNPNKTKSCFFEKMSRINKPLLAQGRKGGNSNKMGNKKKHYN